MKAVVIVVEGVGALMLGPYGSSTSSTPALNRLAAGGLLLDQCFIDSFECARQLRSLWTGKHAGNRTPATWNVWQAWHQAGVPAQLVTDSPEVASIAEQYNVPQVTLVEVAAAFEPADSADQCNLTQVFAAALEILASPETTGVVWIHAQALKHAWDAPMQLREAMIDPEDPLPPADVLVPEIELDEDSDPDLALGWSQVAAAQIALLDEAIEALEQTIAQRTDADEWTWMFCSLGGVPLGEHGTIGLARQFGYAEEVAIPVIIQSARDRIISTRRAQLCQLPDLPVSLMHAMSLPVPDDLWGRNQLVAGPPERTTEWNREQSIAYLETSDHVWLRTPAWSMLLSEEEDHCELYVKPDDRWEASDIADRGVDVVDALRELLPQVRRSIASGNRSDLPQLSDELANLIRN